MSKYREQYDRMERWLQALVEYVGPTPGPEFSAEKGRDLLLAFFLNCFHLRDWIQNDDTVSRTVKRAANKLVFTENTSLKFCADLANGAKHLKRRKGKKLPSGKPRTVLIEHFKLKPNDSDVLRDLFTFKVEPDGGHNSALLLAFDCWMAWHDFFQKHSLSLP